MDNKKSTGHYSKMQDKDELYRLYWTEGKTMAQIGEIYGVSFKRVSKWMKRLGIKAQKTSSGRKYPGRKYNEEFKEKLRQYRLGQKMSSDTKKKISKTLKESGTKAGEKSNWWKGGKFISKGYVFVYAPDSKLPTKRVHKREHRLVLEKHLGRPLKSIEHVHHINGIKTDNRIENLKIVSNYEHAQIHWTDPQHIKEQSERIKKIRKEKFWSSSKPKSVTTG